MCNVFRAYLHFSIIFNVYSSRDTKSVFHISGCFVILNNRYCVVMDNYSKELLKSWDLDILIKHFEENCIDKDSLANLTSDLIKELIPQVGLRIKFNKKWQEHFNTTEDITIKRDENTNLNSVHDITYISDEEISNERDNENNENLDKNCFVGSTVFRKLQRPSVKNILKLTAQGRAILKSYKKHEILNRKCRSTIVDLILSEILNKIHEPLKNEDFDSLSKEIEELFPTETCRTYYVPPIAKRYSRNNKSITSRGKLVDKYRNKIQDYRKLTGYSLITDCSSSTSTPCSSELEDDFTIRESILWLQNNLSPWQLVENHWKVTLAYRRNEIQTSQNKNITEIFSQWPVLKHPTAYTLINKDFKFLNLTSEDSINNWFQFFSKIQAVCPLKDDKITNELCSMIETDNIKDDAKVIVQVLLLSHLIPPKGRIRFKQEHYKSSISECKNSIVLHAKVHGDISRIQDDQVKRTQRLRLTIQPYIIVLGVTLAEVNEFYVCIDRVLYQVSTALTAVDLCFKTFHVFDVNYPPESEHIWYIMQLCLYKFSKKYDKQISYVMPIINAFKTLTSKND